MKFLSFARFFGNQWHGRRPARKAKRPGRRAGFHTLQVEQLETRSLLSGVPTIVSVTPADLSQVVNNSHPVLQIVFSEKMDAATLTNVANYVIYDREGDIIPVNSATVTDAPNNTTVNIAYNNGVDLTADTYSLFVRGDHLLDATDKFSLAPKGQVVAANSQSGLTSVANFNNDGTLAAPGYYTNQNTPTNVVSGDFDGDGIDDIAVEELGLGQIAIFAGRPAADGGGYNFTPTLTLNIPTGGSFNDALLAVDLNRDGLPDLALANYNGNEVTVWLNTSPTAGAIRFATPTNYAAGNNPNSIAAGRFLPGNPNVDLVVGNATLTAPTNGNYTINYLINNGTGNFGATTAVIVGPGTAAAPLLQAPTSVTVGAFGAGGVDPNGLQDILVGGMNGTLLVANTTAAPFTTVAFTAGTALSSGGGVSHLATLNAGGAVDAVATTLGGNRIQILVNGAPTATPFAFTGVQNINVPAGVGGQLLLADVTGDNKPDIEVSSGGSQVTVLKNTSVGATVSFAISATLTADQGTAGIALPDSNQDGKLDLVVANENRSDFTLFLGNGDGTYQNSQNYTGSGTGLSGTAIGDLNGDGIPDVVTINNTSSAAASMVFVYLGKADGTFQAPVSFSPGPGLRSLDSVTLADVTGDGKLDIVFTDKQDSTVGILVNTTPTGGALSFTAVSPIAVGSTPVQVVAADFNNDGRMDLAVAHNGTGTANSQRGVTILRNIGNDVTGLPQFFAGFEVAPGVPAGGIAVADFNRDGQPDFVVTENTAPGSLELFLNNSKTNGGGPNGISFFDGGNFATGIVDPGPVAVGDFNGDGYLDVSVASTAVSATAGGIAVLLNQLGFGFGSPQVNAIVPNTALNGIAVTDVNLDGVPDIIVSVLPGTGLFSTNNFYLLMGSRASGLGDLTPYLAGSGPQQDTPTFVAATGSPLVRVTTFDIVGNHTVNVNQADNGNFESKDLNGEVGNLVGWQTYDLPNNPGGSQGRWSIQTGNNSPTGNSTVPGPTSGNFEAMLDEPGSSPDLSSGTHALYQDFVLPAGASKITLSLDLYIDNSGSQYFTVGGWTDTTLTTTLDYRIIGANQQVRIDLMDPTAPGFNILGTTAAQGVLKTEFITRADSASIITQTLIDDLTAFAGRTIRLRIASANNQGLLLIGIDNVQVVTKFADTTPPTLTNVRLSSPGFLGSPNGNTPHTSDSTVAGQATAAGGVNNIAYIVFDPTGTGFTSSQIRKIGPDSLDALGNFSYTIPNLAPGLVTVGVQVVDRAGNKTSTAITFYYQGVQSASAFQATGPTTINTTADPTVSYKQVSGRITATAADSTDPTGNTILVGTPNGGIWRSTNGGSNWVPETAFLTDSKGNPVLTPIGALAQSKSNPNIWYAGLGVADLQPDSLTGNGVLKSTDDGKTWTLIGNSATVLAGARVSALVIDGNNPSTVYVGVASGGNAGPGVYRSTDGGLTWKNVLTSSVMFSQNFGAAAFPANTPLASVTDLIIDPFNSNRLLVGLGNIGLVAASSVATGVYRTTNFGGTWDNIVGGDTAGIPNDTIPSGLSTAGGASIGRITLAMGTGRVGDEANVYILFDSPPPANGLTAPQYNVGSFTGLYKTQDNLLNFTKVMLRENVPNTPKTPKHNFIDISLNFNEGSNFNALLVDPTNPNVVYVGGSSRYDVPFSQPNQTASFPSQTTPQPTVHAFIRVDTSDMISPYLPDPSGTITNSGDDFESRAIEEEPAPSFNGFYDPTTNSDPYTGEGVYWYDLIGGQSGFTGGANSLPDAITSLAFDAQGRLLVGTVGGIYRGTGGEFGYDFTHGGDGIPALAGIPTYTAPGMTFTSINGNLQIGDLTSVAIDPTHPGTIYSTQYDTGSSTTSSNLLSWATQNTQGGFGGPGAAGPEASGPGLAVLANGSFVTADSPPYGYGYPTSGTVRVAPPNPGSPPDAQTVLFRVWQYASTSQPNEYIPEISLDSGKTWSALFNAGVNQTGNVAGFFPALAVSPTPVVVNGIFEDLVLLGTNRVYLTRTTTNVWDPISPVLSKRNNGVGTISTVTFTPQSGAYYAGTDQGEIFFTANNGADLWPERDTGLPQAKVNAIVVDPNNFQIAYALFNTTKGNAVWRTTNAGLTWTNISTGLPGAAAHDLVIDHSPGLGAPQGKLYVATDAGVFFSNNNGASWSRLSAGSLPTVPASDVQFNASQQVLAVGTLGRGAFGISTAAISPIPDQTAPEDKRLPDIAFSINENGIADNKITVTATSSNQTLIPNANILIADAGPERRLLITPAMFQFGSSTITVKVSDGVNTFTRTFVVNIVFTNHPPTVSQIANQVVPAGGLAGPIVFSVGDAPTETPPAQLVVTAHSSDQTIVPDANILLGGSGASRTIAVSPANPTVTGPVAITVSVADTNGGVTPMTFNVLFTSPVTLPFSDNFNRPNNFFLGAGWVQNFGDFENISNAAQGVSANGVATLQGVTAADVEVQDDVALAATGVQSAGPVARYSGGKSDSNMYWGALVAINGTYKADIYRNVNGHWDTLASTPVATGTGTLTFDVVGPSLKLYLNGTLVTFANDTMLTTGAVGMRTSMSAVQDNFTAKLKPLNTVTLPFTDDFNTVGELGPNWVDDLGDTQVVSGNAAVTRAIDPTSSDPNKYLVLSTLSGVSKADVTVTAAVTLASTGTNWSGLVARYSGPGDTNMYWAGLIGVNGAFQAVIDRNVNGMWVQLNAPTPITLGTPQNTLTFEVVGPSLKLFVNGKLAAFASDTMLTTGTVGLRSSNGVTVTGPFTAGVLTLNTASLPFSDNFGTAGELSANWLNRLGEAQSNGAGIITSVIDPTSSDPNKYLALETVNGINAADVKVSADVTLATTGTDWTGLVARYSGPGDTNMYWAGLIGTNGSFQAVIDRNVNGMWVQLNAPTPVTLGPSPIGLRFEAVGPSLKLFVNNTLVAFANDTMLTTGTVGLRSSTGVTIANFAASAATLNTVSLPFTDNFSTPGELGPNWVDDLGDTQSNGTVATTRAIDPTSSDPNKYLVLSTLSGVSKADVTVTATVTLATTGTDWSGLVARYSGPGDTNMYWAGLIGTNGSFQAVIDRNVNGMWVQLNAPTLVTLGSSTNTLNFQVVGSSLKLFVNNTLVAFASDTVLSAPGSVGLRSSNGVTISSPFTADILTLNNVSLPFSDNLMTAGELSPNWLNRLGELQSNGTAAVTSVVDPASSDPNKYLALETVNGVSNADVSVSATITLSSIGTDWSGLVARYSGPGDTNMYWAGLIGTNGSFQAVIDRNVNGMWVQLNAPTPVTLGSSTNDLRFEVVGPSLKLFVNNTLVAFASDTVLAAPGTVGLRSSTGVSIANFAASVLTLSPASLPFSDSFGTAGELSNNWLNRLGEAQSNGTALLTRTIDPNNTTDPNKYVALETLNGLNAADVTVQTDLALATTGLSFGGLVARYSGVGDQNMYWAGVIGVNGVYTAVIDVNINGKWTVLTSTTVSSNTGTLKFKVQGASLTLTYGTTTLNATDFQLASGTVGLRGSAGVAYQNFSATSP